MKPFFWICMAGALGAGARYLVSGWALKALGPGFPYGTFAVNLIGSFFIALLMSLSSTTEIFSPTLYKVAHITPHAWGIEAFEELILRNGTIADITLELGVLFLFAAVILTLATWRLRISLTKS